MFCAVSLFCLYFCLFFSSLCRYVIFSYGSSIVDVYVRTGNKIRRGFSWLMGKLHLFSLPADHNKQHQQHGQAFDRTGRIVNITVAPQNRTDPPRLLNYLTAPHVVVWSAAVCSSSVPGVFEPSMLLVKDADGR